MILEDSDRLRNKEKLIRGNAKWLLGNTDRLSGKPELESGRTESEPGMSYPVPRKRERNLHTCAQDVQITRMATI
jgi:hypothetical protein